MAYQVEVHCEEDDELLLLKLQELRDYDDASAKR